jgi:carboxypeptidase C (cathepsin A)
LSGFCYFALLFDFSTHPFAMLRLFCLIAIVFPLHAVAQTASDSAAVPDPQVFVTEHEGRFGGQTISYTATAGETLLRNEEGKATGALWSVAYTRNGVADPASRPVTFVFNGGPGSASVWLHMGFFGPRLVQVPSDADADDGAAPYTLIDNPYGMLDLTDLVFIDPIGTGYSRPVGTGKEEDFWGLNEDAHSVAQFIRQWVTEHQRWNAPKYLAGESFGTTRAAAVTRELEGGGQNMALNGLILISQALDYAGSTSENDNITSFLTYFPSMAATAHYHGKAGQDQSLAEFVAAAREFTIAEYAPALLRGTGLAEEDRVRLANRIAGFIGLDPAYVLRSDLRVLVPRFQKELLREEGLTIGRLDGRFRAEEADQVAERPTLGDPASYQIGAAYTAALNHYFATELAVKMDRPYLTSNRQIYPKWNWRPTPEGSGWEPSYVNVSRYLGESMRRNTELRVMVANGYYDLITPFFDAEYTFARNGIVPERVDMHYFEAGHMMYTHRPDLEKLAVVVREFLTR